MIFFYVSLITYFIYTFKKYKNNLKMLQKNKYDNKKILKEIKNKKYFINKELIIILLIIIAVNLDLKTLEISTIVTYTFLSFFSVKENIRIKIEKKIITRIVAETLIFILLNIWFIIDYNNYHRPKGLIFDNSSLYYIILYLYTYLSCFITLIVNILSKPFDKLLK